ncbi:hypothetical protein D3C76_1581550 [compost metagenome]
MNLVCKHGPGSLGLSLLPIHGEQFEAFTPLFKQVCTVVSRNPVQPCRERDGVPETADMLQRLKKNILRGILRLLPASQQIIAVQIN